MVNARATPVYSSMAADAMTGGMAMKMSFIIEDGDGERLERDLERSLEPAGELPGQAQNRPLNP